MVNLREQTGWLPPTEEYYKQYLKKPQKQPPIRHAELGLQLLYGGERSIIPVPADGDNSLYLTYHSRGGAVSSIDTSTRDLLVVQFQGSKQEGYRLTVGLAWVRLMSDQILSIASSTSGFFDRIALPEFSAIKGLMDNVANFDTAQSRYAIFVSIAGLQFSKEEHKYVRDLR